MLAVADCGLGNLHSLLGALAHLAPHARIELTSSASVLAKADAVFLPGDGSFGACMDEIDARGLREPLVQAATSKPFFGICVGMQVLFDGSEEAPRAKGLGLLAGTASRFPQADQAKIPLMGWLDVSVKQPQHPVFADLTDGERFYFLHSYFLPADLEHASMTGEHTASFTAAVACKDLVATQFHPEKSHAQGLALLRNFLALVDARSPAC